MYWLNLAALITTKKIIILFFTLTFVLSSAVTFAVCGDIFVINEHGNIRLSKGFSVYEHGLSSRVLRIAQCDSCSVNHASSKPALCSFSPSKITCDRQDLLSLLVKDASGNPGMCLLVEAKDIDSERLGLRNYLLSLLVHDPSEDPDLCFWGEGSPSPLKQQKDSVLSEELDLPGKVQKLFINLIMVCLSHYCSHNSEFTYDR